MVSRIQRFAGERRENRDHINRFLARRCDRQFLALLTDSTPSFVEALNVGAYLYVVSDVAVIVRLHQFGLLPEAERLRHVKRIRELAVEIPDSGFLDREVRDLFTPDEFRETLEHVRVNFLSDLSTRVTNWRDHYEAGADPDEHFSELRTALQDYRGAFAEDDSVTTSIDIGLAEIDEAIEELQSEMPSEPDRDDYIGGGGRDDHSEGSRSIFDDVDQ